MENSYYSKSKSLIDFTTGRNKRPLLNFMFIWKTRKITISRVFLVVLEPLIRPKGNFYLSFYSLVQFKCIWMSLYITFPSGIINIRCTLYLPHKFFIYRSVEWLQRSGVIFLTFKFQTVFEYFYKIFIGKEYQIKFPGDIYLRSPNFNW